MVWKPRVTVAVIVRQASRFLLVEEHVRSKVVFNQPAGHLEPGESIQHAACRECLEETGHEVSLTHLVGTYQWREQSNDQHFIRFAFAADVVKHHPGRELDEGIVACHWKSVDELESGQLRLRSPMVMRNIHDFLDGRSYPTDLIQYIGDLP